MSIYAASVRLGLIDGVTEGTPASDVELAAYNAYIAAYNLGDDGVVGGDDDTMKQVTNAKDAEPAVSADTQYGFGMSFSASGVTVGLGYDSEKTVSAGMGFSTGDIGTNLLYVKQDGGDTGVGMDLSYTMGATKLTVAYAQGEKGDMKTDAMGLNLSHDLGGGATLVSGFGQVENDMGEAANKASMGLSFSF